MTFAVGDTFAKAYVFDSAGIVAFAGLAGDTNLLHHDLDYASQSRFGGLIASGAQMSSVLMGFGASTLAQHHEAAGLEFSFRFQRAIPAGAATTLRWTVSSVDPNSKLKGQIVSMDGEIVGADGIRHVAATGRAVVWDKCR